MKLTTFKAEDGMSLLADTKWDEPIEARDLSFDEKVDFLRFMLTDETVCNTSVLTNIILLVRGSNLDESDFENPIVVFKDLEEYIDIKQELLAEIGDYRNNVTKYYLGAMKSLCVILPDNKVMTPIPYKTVLMALDLNNLSKIMRNADVNIKDAPLLMDAEDIVSSVAGRIPLMEKLCAMLIDDLGKPAEPQTE